MQARTAAAYLPKILFALGCLMAVMGARAQTVAPVDLAPAGTPKRPTLIATAPTSSVQAVEPVRATARDADPDRVERAENRKMISAWLGIPETELISIMRLVRPSPEERRVAAVAPEQKVAEQP